MTAMSRDLPGYTIPHHFSINEKADFLARHGNEDYLREYLRTGEPPYGIIIQEAYGEILVWRDASGELHVVDITNMAGGSGGTLAEEIQKAPYIAPDSSFIDNLAARFDDLFTSLTIGVGIAAFAAVGYLLWTGLRR